LYAKITELHKICMAQIDDKYVHMWMINNSNGNGNDNDKVV